MTEIYEPEVLFVRRSLVGDFEVWCGHVCKRYKGVHVFVLAHVSP